MSFIFKPMFKAVGDWMKPDMPDAPTPTPTPAADVTTPSVQAAADAERKRLRNQKGRASTMLTGSSGADTGASVGTTKLLGG